MSSLEHVGQSVTAYYHHVAQPNFSMPPDKMAYSVNSSLSLEHHALGDARLTTIAGPRQTQRYIRFFELAAGIPDAERALLGFPSFGKEEDLVIACPQPGATTVFQIVPSEVMHSARMNRRYATARRLAQPHLLSAPETRWGTIHGDKYARGIYQYLETRYPSPNIRDISEQLPATMEACLSVANLLVSRNIDYILGQEGPTES